MRILMGMALCGIISSFSVMSTPALAWQCTARSANGATGIGSAIILERAQKSAIQRCAAAGGNISGYACSIRQCR
jgi:hypothetical protein